MNSAELINKGSIKLKKNNIASHQIDSELILSSVLRLSKEKLLINSNY